jgi:hypothetical protein
MFMRTCTSARVVKHAITFGRILFKFDGHILQMTTSYMGYILNMFKHQISRGYNLHDLFIYYMYTYFGLDKTH